MTRHIPPETIPAPKRPVIPQALYERRDMPMPRPARGISKQSTHLDSGDHSANDDAIVARLEEDMVSRAGEPAVSFAPRRPLPTFTEMLYSSGLMVFCVIGIIALFFAEALGAWK